MSGIAKCTMTAAAVAAAALTLTVAGPAPAQDIYSLQARVMQLEARVREITTYRPVESPTRGNEALSQRIRTLELTIAEMQNALKHMQNEIDRLNAARPR